MNKAILMGRLTADPELRQTQSGIALCRFTLAVNRPVKNKQTNEYDADFISCVAWRQTAEFISRYFSKGRMIMVEGTLRTGSYKDKNHPDITHYTTEVYAENVEFCGEKSNNQNAQTQNQYIPQQNSAAVPQQTDLNFGSISDFEEILSDGDVPF